MTDAKWTPGPWTGYTTGILSGGRWVVSNDPDDRGAIMSRADARLIAAAPEMLAALRLILDETELVGLSERCKHARGICRAAILKAEGGSDD